MATILKPPALKPASVVGVVAPASPVSREFLERGVDELERRVRLEEGHVPGQSPIRRKVIRVQKAHEVRVRCHRPKRLIPGLRDATVSRLDQSDLWCRRGQGVDDLAGVVDRAVVDHNDGELSRIALPQEGLERGSNRGGRIVGSHIDGDFHLAPLQSIEPAEWRHRAIS